jgi:Iap family predicted aminopeptidase
VVKDKEAYRDRLAEALSKLANHRVQDMLFDEIEIQLDAFVTHANMYSQNETTEHLRSALSLVRSVRAQKNKSSLSKDDIQQNKTDEVYRSIVNSIVDIEYDRTIT